MSQLIGSGIWIEGFKSGKHLSKITAEFYRAMNRQSPFSYQCNQCGRCCHDKVVTLSPYDVIRIARMMGISTSEAVRRYTIRRGSILRFLPEGACSALDGTRCGLHRGRPLACRFYPLGIERSGDSEQLITLDPADGSLGVYAQDSTAGNFIDANGTSPYFAALEKYCSLIATFRTRITSLVDFEAVEAREFWRRAVVEALLENNFDPNPIIDAMFDPDSNGCADEDIEETVAAHLTTLDEMIRRESDRDKLAAAAVILAVSLGYSPAEVIVPR